MTPFHLPSIRSSVASTVQPGRWAKFRRFMGSFPIVSKQGPRGRDIRVAVKAISANPVDYKVRKRAAPPEGETKILGYDATGIIDAVGPEVTLFKAGDEVFYAGSIQRQGTNSEFHLVDERIVGAKPKTLSFAQTAALPLTSITAWELLFDRLGAAPG